MNKTCTHCHKDKDVSSFHKKKSGVDGLQSWCKGCRKEHKKHIYSLNREKILVYNKDYNDTHKTERSAYYKKYYALNKESLALKNKVYRDTHLEDGRAYQRKRYASSEEKERIRRKEWRRNNPNYSNDYHKKRRGYDLNYKLIANIRTRTYLALKGKIKSTSVIKSFGCSDLAEYIRSTYSPGMSDDNYGNRPGQWSVDHIIPLSLFDLSDPVQLSQANHYTNLKAMWHIDNVKKSNKIGEISNA